MRAKDARRGSRYRRGYRSHHEAMRRLVLREEPHCRICGEPTTDADHIVPLRLGGSEDRSNYQGLCGYHHRQKTAMQDGGFGNPIRANDGP
jgi:5-methylcytosine-specific restriction protein A